MAWDPRAIHEVVFAKSVCQDFDAKKGFVLLMDEILHHLECIKP